MARLKAIQTDIANVRDPREYFHSAFYNKDIDNFIFIGTSIWDDGQVGFIKDFMTHTMNQLGIRETLVQTQATMDSTEWVNGIFPESNRDLAVASCRGNGGENSIVAFEIQINDIDYGNSVDYDWGTYMLPRYNILKANIQSFLDLKPNVKLFFVGPPCSADEAFNIAMQRLNDELEKDFGYKSIRGFHALKGVRQAIQYSPGNIASAYFNDGIHPLNIGRLRFWNFITMEVLPEEILPLIKTFNLDPIDTNPDDQATTAIINNSWRNDFDVSDELKNSGTTTNRCFNKFDVIEGQLIKLKLPPLSLMGTYTHQVRWVLNDVSVYSGNLIDLIPI